MGTIAHAFLAEAALAGREAALAKIPDEHRDWVECLDLDRLPLAPGEYWPEVAAAYDMATGKARILGHNMTRAKAKALKSPSETVGLMDVAADAGDGVFVADWKTGFGHVTPAASNWQLKAYALFLARALDRNRATISIVRVRTDGAPPWYDTAQLDDLDLAAFETELQRLFAMRSQVRAQTRARQWDALPKFHEGTWCKYCPAQRACPAKVGDMLLVTQDKGQPLNLDDAKAAHVWQVLKLAPKVLTRWQGVVEDYAQQQPFPIGDGVWVGPLLDKKPTETLVPAKAREALTKHLGDELGGAVFSDAVEISDSLTKASLKRSLRKLVLPTRPSTTKLTHLEKEVLEALRAGGATHAPPLKKIPVDEYRPKVVEKDEPEEEAA